MPTQSAVLAANAPAIGELFQGFDGQHPAVDNAIPFRLRLVAELKLATDDRLEIVAHHSQGPWEAARIGKGLGGLPIWFAVEDIAGRVAASRSEWRERIQGMSLNGLQPSY